jgi:DNA-directed RNA polymerase subunit RPC12/RpoP
MPSPRFEKVQELFRMRAEIEEEIEQLLMGDEGESPPRLNHTGREKPIGHITKVSLKNGQLLAEGTLNRKPCGCAIRDRPKKGCAVCSPTDDALVSQPDPEWNTQYKDPRKKPCGCHMNRQPKRLCRICNRDELGPDPNDKTTDAELDDELRPLKRYKCIECGREVESRQHRLDLTCAKPCFNKTLVEVFPV